MYQHHCLDTSLLGILPTSSSHPDRVPSASPSTLNLTDMDILCGRGRGAFEHSGNRRMLLIIAPHKQAYQLAPKVEKAKIARYVYELIVNQVDAVGSRPRFMRKVNTSEHNKNKDSCRTGDSASCWDELSKDEAIKKVAHTLREQKAVVNRSAMIRQKNMLHVNEQNQSQRFVEGESDNDDSESATSSSSVETTIHTIACDEDHHQEFPPGIYYPEARCSLSSSVISPCSSVLSTSMPSDGVVRSVWDKMEKQLNDIVDSRVRVNSHGTGTARRNSIYRRPSDVVGVMDVMPLPDDIFPLDFSLDEHSMFDSQDLSSLLDILQ